MPQPDPATATDTPRPAAPIPRPEHPRPSFVRDSWMCLNGEWEFEIDAGDSGQERGLVSRPLEQVITVPFAPESSLSGIERTDFLNAVWYRRTVEVPAAWAGLRLLLHLQAVDYEATVWGNGIEVGRHRGGYTTMTCDVTGVARAGEPVAIVVRARDDHRGIQPRGKQSPRYENFNCFYTRTTGIWQTVWLEGVPGTAVGRPRILPDPVASRFIIEVPVSDSPAGARLRARLSAGGAPLAEATTSLGMTYAPLIVLDIPAGRRRLWSPSDPHLYDIELELQRADGTVVDRTRTYAGLRGLAREGNALLVNGEVLFQRLVLDQGYWRDGILTAPSDDELRGDIERALSAGFNGARLHQKVAEERYLFHADRLGFLVWSEFPDWGSTGEGTPADHQAPTTAWVTQWLEVLQRDRSHPCVVGWCGLNETSLLPSDRGSELDDVTHGMFLAARGSDLSRPVIDASGFAHRVAETDVYDVHDYTRSPDVLRDRYAAIRPGEEIGGTHLAAEQARYGGQPLLVSEFGGASFLPAGAAPEGWGYGEAVDSEDGFLALFEAQCRALADSPHVAGYCYTQLTDVFQEQNGLWSFDRRPKVDPALLRRAQSGPAAIELRRADGGPASELRRGAAEPAAGLRQGHPGPASDSATTG